MSRLLGYKEGNMSGYRLKPRWVLVILLLVLGIVLMWLGLLWLVAMVGVVVLVRILVRKGRSRKGHGWKARLYGYLRGASVFVLIFIIGIGLRVFLVEIYAIPSSSMEAALVPGDKIIVNKLAYGPVLPESPYEIPWINLLFYLFAGDHKADSWGYERLSGYSEVKEGDVLVFQKHPKDPNVYIKRCIAGPGRELLMTGAIPEHLKGSKTIAETLIPMQIWVNKPAQVGRAFDSMEVFARRGYFMENEEKKGDFYFRARPAQIDHIKSWGSIDSLKLKEEFDGIRSHYLKSIDSTWTVYDFGPLVVPVEGMELVLNDSTFNVYGGTIREFEQGEIEKKDGLFWLKGRSIETYTFQHNYYFMMGDNREDSNDSRYSGFVPEQNIIGRADWILFSNFHDGFNWERFMKTI